MRTSFCCLLFLSVILTGTVFAGETGKLSGVVRDKDSKEPLIGANILVMGTSLGATSDVSGYYFVNRVPPGTYRVQVSLIGYGTIVFNDVRLMADLTTELNAVLSTSAVEMGTVEVTAQRPVVQRDLTTTRAVVEGETIVRDLRFQDVGEILRLQAGVTRGTDGVLHVRGGRSGGTVYQIDGVPVQNPLFRSTSGEIEVENVQELQALLGTFDAEYGNASDGIVTIYTKDGGERYRGRFAYESPRLNSSPYQKADWNLDRSDVQALSPGQQGLYLDEVRKPDGSSAYEYVSVLDDQYARDLMPVKVLGTWSANFSGPVPFLDPLTFYATGRLRQENNSLPYGYALLRSLTFKLTYPLSSGLTLRGSLDLSEGNRQTYDHAYKYWRWWDTGLDPAGRMGSYPIINDQNNRETFSLRHVLSPKTFYDISLSRLYDYSDEVVPDRTVTYDGQTGELLSSDYVRRQWVGGNDSGFRYGDVRYWTRSEATQYLAKGNLESQIHPSHQIRTGFEITANEVFRHRIGMPTIPNLQYFTYKPVGAALYLQDKVEYSFMILKAGLRVDYFDPQASEYPDPSQIISVTTAPGGTAEYVAAAKIPVKPYVQLSPRVGIAHPISDKTSIHFAYGHFFQTPTFYDLYRNDDLEDILVADALIGNPGLKPERTVSFEVGLQQELSADWGLNITAYSKDITNLTSSYYYFSGRDYSIFINADYGRVQGIDITLDKGFSDFYSGRITYTLMSAIGNQSDPLGGYDYREEQAPLRPNRNYPLDFDQRHKITAVLTSRTPERFGPELLGFHPFEYFALAAVFTAGSGLPYTPTSRAAEETGIVPEPNSARRPWAYNLDLKLSREIPLGGIRLTGYFDVTNLFDAINTNLVWTRTGDPWDEGPTSVRTKDRQANPENVATRRIMRVGVIMEF